MVHSNPRASTPPAEITLSMRPERRLIRPHGGSYRHVDFHIGVSKVPRSEHPERPPLAISLVLDRSGSMHGDKMVTARQAAIAVLDRLEERDRVATVVFDDHIDVLQESALVTPEVRARLRAELAAVQARGNTALHEGWLTGCKAITSATPEAGRLTRCFLLTDGLANSGVTDVEQIASDAAGVRANAGVGTSTFGIGLDYNEALLGPMAVAGGGQFHNLRSPAEIATTFLGELGELSAVAVRDVRLDIEAAPGTTAEMISPYWVARADEPGGSWSVTLGDLLAGEDRHVVVRFGFMTQLAHTGLPLRARLVWVGMDGQPASGPWQELVFEYADHAARAAERAHPVVQGVVGRQHAERAHRMAIERARNGDVAGARDIVNRVAGRIAEYAGDDPALRQAVQGLRQAALEFEQRGYVPAVAKEAYFASQTMSRGQRDLRGQPE
jgi:Ca-activated chloride channel family protein